MNMDMSWRDFFIFITIYILCALTVVKLMSYYFNKSVYNRKKCNLYDKFLDGSITQSKYEIEIKKLDNRYKNSDFFNIND